MFAPAGTPKAIIDKIAGEMDRALKDPKFLALIQGNGIDPLGYGPGKFAEFVKAEYRKWGEAVETAGVKLRR
jgi:tripartite-type tricarboxylate transporter receptor subunit TctC